MNYFFKSEKIESTITGVYLPKTRTLELKATPVLNYKATNSNGADCPMEGSFTYMSSQVETTLRGQFNPLYSYRFTCPAINVKLKKELVKGGKITRELPEETENLLVFEEPVKEPEPEPQLELLNKRSFDVLDEIEVESDTVTAILYDNSEIDYDTVSLFYNKRLIASKNMLSDKPLTFKLPINDTGRNEISMYAENLGKLPPNTALMIIMDGEKRMEYNLVSTYIKNSTLRFKKKKKATTSSN